MLLQKLTCQGSLPSKAVTLLDNVSGVLRPVSEAPRCSSPVSSHLFFGPHLVPGADKVAAPATRRASHLPPVRCRAG
jgi:hypothetical protein